MLPVLLALTGCSRKEPASESEKKFNPESIQSGLSRRGVNGDSRTNNPTPTSTVTHFPGYGPGSAFQVTESTYQSRSTDISTAYNSLTLSSGSYQINSITLRQTSRSEDKTQRTWERPSYHVPRAPIPPAPQNPDNDDWGTPPAPSYPPVPTTPQNPDNDDWGNSPSTPTPSGSSNPDNDDWGASLNPDVSPSYAMGSIGSLLFPLLGSTAYAGTQDVCTPGSHREFKALGSTIYTCAEYSNSYDVPQGLPRGEWVPTRMITPLGYPSRSSSDNVSINFTFTENGQSATCDLEMSRSGSRSDWRFNSRSGDSLNCGSADWAESSTDDRGRATSRGREHVNGLSNTIQGVGNN